MRLAAGLVVNAAGLGAQAFARSIAGMPVDKIPPLHLAKGNYFSLSGRSPFSRRIARRLEKSCPANPAAGSFRCRDDRLGGFFGCDVAEAVKEIDVADDRRFKFLNGVAVHMKAGADAGNGAARFAAAGFLADRVGGLKADRR